MGKALEKVKCVLELWKTFGFARTRGFLFSSTVCLCVNVRER